MKSLFFISFFVCVLFITISAQSDSTRTEEEIISDLLEDSSIETDQDYLINLLDNFRENPININKADITKLLEIPFLDYSSAKAIVDYRNKYGKYFSKSELYSVDGLSDLIAGALQNFVTIKEKKENNFFSLSDLSIEFRSRLIRDLQPRRGFSENKYLGSEYKSYQRLKINTNNLHFSGLMEKDPGEKKYNDFTSYSLLISNYKFIKNLVLGDYLLEYGQGLILASPYSFGKGSQAIRSVTRSANFLRNYTSSDENQFKRGGAIQLDFQPITLSFFYSNHAIDANIDSSNNEITSLNISGYHRTQSEISKIDLVKRTSAGAIINASLSDNFEIGASYLFTKFDKPLQQSDIFSPSGRQFNFYSFSYSYYLGDFWLSGESAYNGISLAHIINLEWKISNRLSFVTSLRTYPRNYYTIDGNGFGESSNTSNEIGIYNGLRWRTEFGLINFYYDQFKFPYATYLSPIPSKGDEYLLDYRYRPMNKSLLKLRFKRENKEVPETINEEKLLVSQYRTNYRTEFEFYPVKYLRSKTRLEYVTFSQKENKKNEKGFLLFQDFRYDPTEYLRIYGRIILFQTDSYDSRVYEFENNIRGVLYNPPLYGKGMRWYFILEYDITANIKISMKYAELYKPDEMKIGSGLNEITGNLDNRLSIQLDFRY